VYPLFPSRLATSVRAPVWVTDVLFEIGVSVLGPKGETLCKGFAGCGHIRPVMMEVSDKAVGSMCSSKRPAAIRAARTKTLRIGESSAYEVRVH